MKKTKVVPVTYVIYLGHGEVIVTTPDREKGVLKEYFQPDNRVVDEYDRIESREPCVCLTPSLQVD